VPEFRIYQDCVPGRTIGWVWFQATQTGDFQLACNQLCGTGHYNMKAPIHIVSEAEFQKWLTPRQQKNAALVQPSPIAAPSPAKAASLTDRTEINTL
jgi:cytochrome c oxidase subunit 2